MQKSLSCVCHYAPETAELQSLYFVSFGFFPCILKDLVFGLGRAHLAMVGCKSKRRATTMASKLALLPTMAAIQ